MLDSGSATLCHRSCSFFLWTCFVYTAGGQIKSILGTTGFLSLLCVDALADSFEPGSPACTGAVCSLVCSVCV